MKLFFITGSKHKLAAAQEIIPELQQLDIDIPELQELDSKKIIAAKIDEAQKYLETDAVIIVEDTSFTVLAAGGLPGPLIKWFLNAVGCEGVWNMFKHYSHRAATVASYIGIYDGQDTHFFIASADGEIVSPSGDGYGWDSLFKPTGSTKTFAQMTHEEKEPYAMRQQAFRKVKDFLHKKSLSE